MNFIFACLTIIFSKLYTFGMEMYEEELGNYIVVDEEPEFVAETDEDISASYFILCENSGQENLVKRIYEYEICGMSSLNWVARACESQPVVIRANDNANVIKTIRPYVKGAEYSVVLFANTPLVNKQHLKDVLAYMNRKHMNALKLKKGYIFRNDYILHNDEMYSVDTYEFSTDDFFEVNTLEDLSVAQESLSKKVLSYHMLHGVYFERPEVNSVDATSEIGYNTTIASNVSIVKNSIVGDVCEIKEDAIIKNSKIGDDVMIGEGAFIISSIIKDGAKIDSRAFIKNSVIGENVVIKENVSVINSGIKANSLVEECSKINKARVGENVKIGKFCKLIGELRPAVVLSNSILDANVEVLGATVGENVTITVNQKIFEDVDGVEV